MATNLVPAEFRAAALSFPDRVRAALATLDTPAKAAKALRGGDGLLRFAKDIKATREQIDAIQHGRFLLMAKLGELLPADNKGGRGKKNQHSDCAGFHRNTLASYRKVTAHEEKIDPYFVARGALPDHIDVKSKQESASLAHFFDYVGNGGVMATRHGNEIIEWYTPEKYIQLARKAMGGIDLDPATSAFAQKTVKAKAYFTAKDDGLSRKWSGRVFLNPPFKQPLGKQFVAKLCDEVESGRVKQAVLLTNDQTDTDWWHRAAKLAAAVCFLDGRIGFYNQAGETSAPTNGQTFCYYGERLATFAAVFSEIGLVMSAR